MKIIKLCFFSILLLGIGNLNAQLNQGNCPNNIDFEFGNFTNWQLATGSVSDAGTAPAYTWTGFVQMANRHEILTTAANSGQLDPYGNFPVLCPNGSGYSVKLGNNNNGHEAEKLDYTFTVPIGFTTYSLTYYYAAVLNVGAGHSNSVQPRFTVKLIDVVTNQDLSACASYDYNANDASGAFLPSSILGPGNSQVKYKVWTPVTYDLSGLNGKTLRLEFITNDCTQQQHFGYGYVDVGSICVSPVTGYAYCTGQASMTLSAPFGYENYYWYNQNYTTVLGTSQTLTLTPPPPNGTILNLDLVPFTFGGCRDTLPVTIEEQSIPDTPVIASFFSYCQNEVATQLQINPAPGFIPLWYTAATGGAPLGVPPTPNTSTVGSTDYYVSLQTFGGCEGPRKKVTVIVTNPPAAEFSINDTTQCLVGNNFAFTSTSTNISAATQYEWDFGDASGLVTNTTTPTHHYIASGTYSVSLRVKNNASCQSQKIIPVTVVTTPIANFTVTPNCAGNSFAFTNTTTGGNAQNTFDWDFGGGNTSTATNPTVTFNTPGTFNVKLTASTAGCTHDTTKPVTVNPNPKANFTVSSLCFGDSTQFNQTATIVSGAITSYTWDFGGGNTSTLPNPKFKFATSGTHAVKLTVSSGFGCSHDTTINITLSDKPVAYFTRVDTACLNAPFILKDSSYFPTNTSNSTLNQWWWNAGSNIYNTKDIITSNNGVGAFQINQVVISDKGCVSDTNKVIIDIKGLPLAQIGVSAPLCFNRDIQFTDNTTNSATRTWQLSNGYTGTQKSFTVNNLLVGVTNVKLTVKDSFGCQGVVKDTNLIINPRPRLNFTYADSCLEKIVPFTAVDLDNNYITQWKWNFEGYIENGSNAKDHLFAHPGINNIFLYGVAGNGCVSDTMYKRLFIYNTDAYAGEDRLAASNEPIQLTATGGITYQWTPNFRLNNGAVANPVATVDADQLYKVKVTSKFGCTSTDDVWIKIYKGPDVYIPTIFTPNRDGKNDVLQLTLIGIKEFKFINIYDRFGTKVFTTTDPTISWDGTRKGKNVETETFVYVCSAVDINGKTINKKGTVIVVR